MPSKNAHDFTIVTIIAIPCRGIAQYAWSVFVWKLVKWA